ncbi:MAG: hypothetical protein FWF87_00710 [Synergistaceae bacterium]|nr:hypothetical protein [Synergistaceae bacterium]
MDCWNDHIVAEVRNNREAILADFNGDIHRFIMHLKEQHPIKDAEGWKAVTIKDVEAVRASWRK